MKAKIDIVLGFLGSGKTSFINSMLKTDEFENETIVIIQDEFGQTDIKDEFLNSSEDMKIINIKNDSNEEINDIYIKNILMQYSPNRILIELNGMKNSSDVINIFNDKSIKKLCKINNIAAIIDAKQFFVFFKNLKHLFSNQIFNSDTIVLNNVSKLDKKDFLSIQKEIKKINETANIIEHVPNLNIKEFFQEEFREIDSKHNFFMIKALLYMSLLILLFT
jgi:G3E family GTPase